MCCACWPDPAKLLMKVPPIECDVCWWLECEFEAPAFFLTIFEDCGLPAEAVFVIEMLDTWMSPLLA